MFASLISVESVFVSLREHVHDDEREWTCNEHVHELVRAQSEHVHEHVHVQHVNMTIDIDIDTNMYRT
jgi:hypothetical protein